MQGMMHRVLQPTGLHSRPGDYWANVLVALIVRG